MRSLKMDGFLVRCHELRHDILKKFFQMNETKGNRPANIEDVSVGG